MDPNTVWNKSKLIDLVMWIELIQVILLPWLRFAEFNHPFLHVFIGNMFPESQGFLLCQSQAQPILSPFSN